MISHTRPPRPRTPSLGAIALRLAHALMVIGVVLAAWPPTAGAGRARAASVRVRVSTSTSTLRIWYGTDDPSEQAVIRTLTGGFSQSHPSVRVSLTTYGLDDLNTKLQLALSAGTPPDLIYTTPRGPGLPAYVRAGRLLDMTQYARRRGWAARLRPGLLAQYNALLALNSRSTADRGHLFAVPYVLAAVGILYNTTIFAALHLAIPRTLDDLTRDLPKIQRAGFTPLGLGNADGWVGDDWWLTLVNARVDPATLAPALRLDPHFSFESAPYKWAGQTLQDWSKRGYFTQDFGGLDAQDSIAAFFEGKTAMQLVSSTQNPQILSLARHAPFGVGVFAFPGAGHGQPAVMPQSGYAGWAVPAAARNAQTALMFIDQMTSDSTARYLLAEGMLPAYRLARAELHPAAPFQGQFIRALDAARPGIYLDSAPVPNINATMEANVQLLLQNDEPPEFLIHSLQEVYASYGAKATSTRTDGEF